MSSLRVTLKSGCLNFFDLGIEIQFIKAPNASVRRLCLSSRDGLGEDEH